MASRVLVVEDEPDIRDLLAFHLERDGYLPVDTVVTIRAGEPTRINVRMVPKSE